MNILEVSISSTVKQAYIRAMRVPQVGRAAGDPLCVWEDYFEQLHQNLGLTSLSTCAIIGSEDHTMDEDKAREEAEATQYAECQQLRNAIAADLERLPKRDVFGGSNAKDKAWMRRLIRDFDRVLTAGEAQMEEVQSWLAGDDAWFLNDFLPDPQGVE